MDDLGFAWLIFNVVIIGVLFLPTLLALFWRRDRLFATFALNLSAFFIGPIGTLLAIAAVVAPKELMERFLQRLHARKIANQPRAWRERSCPACRQWMARTSRACPHCHARVAPLDQECPACKQAMPLTATTCLARGCDQRAGQESRASGPT
jgi:hypothetical protein